MKFARLLPLLLLLTVLCFVTSCSDDGSEGPAGAQGEKGEKGDTGDKGEPGDAGDASVIYSPWLTLPYSVDSEGIYSVDIIAPKITKAILSTGDARVYVNLTTTANPVIAAIPYTDTKGMYIQYLMRDGGFSLFSNFDASTYMNNENIPVREYRYVIIPGSKVARKAQNINWDNYAEVKAAFNLPD